jgi:hypothetical protein
VTGARASALTDGDLQVGSTGNPRLEARALKLRLVGDARSFGPLRSRAG